MRRPFAWIASFALVVGGALPAYAYDSPEEARDALYAVADKAIADIEAVVAGLEKSLPALTTESQVDAAVALAKSKVDAIRLEAIGDINDIKAEYPSQLQADAVIANADIRKARDAAHDDIDELGAQAIIALQQPSTTSTTSTTTTTTSTTSSTSTSTTSTVPANKAGGLPPRSQPPPPAADSPPSVTDDHGASGMSLAIMGPTALPAGNEGARSEGAEGQGLASAMARQLEVILPPAIAQLVVTPFVIAEILIGTVIDGGRAIALPLGLLALAMGIFLLVDRLRERGEPKRDAPVAPVLSRLRGQPSTHQGS